MRVEKKKEKKKQAVHVSRLSGGCVCLEMSLYAALSSSSPSLFLSQGSSFNSKEVTVYLSLSTGVTVCYLPSSAWDAPVQLSRVACKAVFFFFFNSHSLLMSRNDLKCRPRQSDPLSMKQLLIFLLKNYCSGNEFWIRSAKGNGAHNSSLGSWHFELII